MNKQPQLWVLSQCLAEHPGFAKKKVGYFTHEKKQVFLEDIW